MADKAWKQFERDVCRELAAFYYPDKWPMTVKLPAEENPFRRTPGSGAWAGRKSMVADVQAPKSFALSVECKRQQAWSFDQIIRGKSKLVESWWDQTVAAAVKARRIPLLVFTKPFMGTYVRYSEVAFRFMSSHGEMGLVHPAFLVQGSYHYATFSGFLGTLNAKSMRSGSLRELLRNEPADSEVFQ